MQRVLLIDDSPVQLHAREAVLRDAGFDVEVAATAESALALLRSPHQWLIVRSGMCAAAWAPSSPTTFCPAPPESSSCASSAPFIPVCP